MIWISNFGGNFFANTVDVFKSGFRQIPDFLSGTGFCNQLPENNIANERAVAKGYSVEGFFAVHGFVFPKLLKLSVFSDFI